MVFQTIDNYDTRFIDAKKYLDKKQHISLYFEHDFTARLNNLISFDKLRNKRKTDINLKRKPKQQTYEEVYSNNIIGLVY